MRTVTLIAAALLAVSATAANARALSASTPAKILFSKAEVPTAGPPRPIGSYADGCMAGGEALPVTGPHWQVMRLSRNRNWGQPELVKFIEKFSADVARDGWPGLLVGDMSQPRGGPMITGHASHQIGLDVDIWLTPMPDHVLSRAEREKMGAQSLLVKGKRLVLNMHKWSDVDLRLYKRAASYPDVVRIFASAAIKKELCETAGTDRAWLRKIRPWYGHDDHMHIRLACPPGIAGCVDQARAAARRRLRQGPRLVVPAAPAAADPSGQAEAAAAGKDPCQPAGGLHARAHRRAGRRGADRGHSGARAAPDHDRELG